MNAIAAPTPEYPQEFFRAGREGTVIATIRVETDGAVSTADVLEATDDLMGTSVVRALKQRRFKPFKTDANEAIRVTSRLVFHFAIRNGQPMVVEGTGAPHA